MFILDELSTDAEIKEFLEIYRDLAFQKCFAFLVKTDIFVKAARNNYYLDLQRKWNVLKVMQPKAIRAYWEQRKEIFLKREPINWRA